PSDAVEVSNDEWQTYCQGQPPEGMQRGAGEDGRPCWVDLPETPIDDLAASAMSRINAGYQAEMSEILRAYPNAETLTWDKQEEEARKWIADNTAATPLLDAIAQGRSMDKAELVSRVIAKADAWIAASGLATGKRQALEDEISAALATDDRAA